MANRFVQLAIRGRCSEIETPGVRVAMALNGPPCAWPGFKSNVSVWLGPPFIQSRRQDRLGRSAVSVAAASARSQPPSELPNTVPVVAASQLRRDNCVAASQLR